MRFVELTQTNHSEVCNICDGVEVLNDVEIPGGNGMTCELLVFSYASAEVTTEDCINAQTIAQSLCCLPSTTQSSPVSSPCKFCDGRQVLNDVEIPGLNGLTCEFTAYSATLVDASADECTVLALAELVCCPESPTRCVCLKHEEDVDAIYPQSDVQLLNIFLTFCNQSIVVVLYCLGAVLQLSKQLQGRYSHSYLWSHENNVV